MHASGFVLLIGLTLCSCFNFTPIDIQNPMFDACRQNQGDDSDDIQASIDKATHCITELVNFKEAAEETAKVIEENIGGGLNDVFEKYCGLKDQVKECAVTFKDKLDECLDDERGNVTEHLMDIFERILNFICYEDGNRIALFMAEKGVDCVTVMIQNDKFSMCANKTLPYYQNTSADLLDVLNLFSAEEKSCSESFNFRNCILREMENCEKPTPGNLMEGLLNEILKASPCVRYMSVSSSDAPLVSLGLVLFHSAIVYLVR